MTTKFVVDVVERHDPENGVRGYAARFEFEDGEAAWQAYQRAVKAGFEARGNKVQERERVNA